MDAGYVLELGATALNVKLLLTDFDRPATSVGSSSVIDRTALIEAPLSAAVAVARWRSGSEEGWGDAVRRPDREMDEEKQDP